MPRQKKELEPRLSYYEIELHLEISSLLRRQGQIGMFGRCLEVAKTYRRDDAARIAELAVDEVLQLRH